MSAASGDDNIHGLEEERWMETQVTHSMKSNGRMGRR